MIGKYSDKAMATMEKIKNDVVAYIPNKTYKNKIHNIFWFINSHGYMHILRPTSVKMDGKILYYAIEDYLLTKDNMLESKGYIGNYKSVQDVINELENRIK